MIFLTAISACQQSELRQAKKETMTNLLGGCMPRFDGTKSICCVADGVYMRYGRLSARRAVLRYESRVGRVDLHGL